MFGDNTQEAYAPPCLEETVYKQHRCGAFLPNFGVLGFSGLRTGLPGRTFHKSKPHAQFYLQDEGSGILCRNVASKARLPPVRRRAQKEGRQGLESSTGVLSELAKREQALSSKVEAAKVEAAKLISDAEAKAKELLGKAESDVKTLTDEFKVRREAEEKNILESGAVAARSAADAAKSAALTKVADAVKTIVGRVLP
jgi:vacuolar-type H+-ATPase subunit H